MKIKFFLLVVLIVTSQLANAQKLDAQEMADYQTETMAAELNLSQEQVSQVEKLNLKFSQKQVALMEEEGSMFGKMGDMKKIAKAKNKALEEIFTEEQMEKYKDDVEPEIRKHMRKKIMG